MNGETYVNRHVNRIEAAIASRTGAASALVASWRRSSAAHKQQLPPIMTEMFSWVFALLAAQG